MTSENGHGDEQKTITCHVMDVEDDESAGAVPLSNKCYPSDISKIALESEEKAAYRCRWIHLSSNYDTFDEYLAIVKETLRTREAEEQSRIMTALRTLKRRKELRGTNGPNFRPGLFPFFEDEWHENLLHSPEQVEANDFQPMFMSIPTLHVGMPWPRSFRKSQSGKGNMLYSTKTLLEYHYRFNRDLDGVSGANAVINPTPVAVRELWCLVVDKKNIITGSTMGADLLWPNAKTLDLPHSRPWASFSYAFWENPPFVPDNLHTAFDLLLGYFLGRSPVMKVGFIGLLLSRLTPFDGRIVYKLNDFIIKKLGGVEFSTLMRISSVSTMRPRAEDVPMFADSFFFWFRVLGIARIKLGNAKLSSLRKLLQEWEDNEAGLWLPLNEEGLPGDIFANLKKLWTIAFVFSSNFYLDLNGHVYSLGPRTISRWVWNPWKRRKAKEKQQGEAQDSNSALDVPIYYHPRKPGETLRDLERDLSETINSLQLQKQSETDASNSNNDNHRENLLLLEEIHRAGSNPSLLCLLRACVFLTPARFSTFNRLVVEFYANKISRLEWLIRDQATQSLVYQLSRLADELRIAKEIVISQRDVAIETAERLTDAISTERSRGPKDASLPSVSEKKDEKEGACDCSEDTGTGLRHRKAARVANTLQAKARIKHDNLLADLEKLEDTTERLKRQAALLLDIKAEGQNTAIFVFTIVTVIFLPLSFVTSFFGMNTSDIRDIDQTQWIFWVFGITLTAAILVIVWLVSVKGSRWRLARQAGRVHDHEY
ncbi:cora-like Mg2+ transporter protein-domain-containing protein [Nemania sp. NC0429]|nr:cora-like Mg2+ transporter protein-domain-containing protein [Nemania sp. NC0429]